MNQIPYLPVEQQFQRNAELYGERIALIKGEVSEDRVAYDYGSLNKKSNQYANYLQLQNIKPGAAVAVFVTDPLEIIPAMIGLFKMGAIFIPLNPADFPQRTRDVLQEIQPQCIIVDDDNLAPLNVAIESISISNTIINICSADFIKFADDSQPQYNPDLDDICYVYYSSGTTGKPKGITGTRRGISHFIRWEIEWAINLRDLNKL